MVGATDIHSIIAIEINAVNIIARTTFAGIWIAPLAAAPTCRLTEQAGWAD